MKSSVTASTASKGHLLKASREPPLVCIDNDARPAPRTFQPCEVHALVRGAGRHGRYLLRSVAIVMLLLQTGMRIGEWAT
jgi:site-specific recombinase XerD